MGCPCECARCPQAVPSGMRDVPRRRALGNARRATAGVPSGMRDVPQSDFVNVWRANRMRDSPGKTPRRLSAFIPPRPKLRSNPTTFSRLGLRKSPSLEVGFTLLTFIRFRRILAERLRNSFAAMHRIRPNT